MRKLFLILISLIILNVPYLHSENRSPITREQFEAGLIVNETFEQSSFHDRDPNPVDRETLEKIERDLENVKAREQENLMWQSIVEQWKLFIEMFENQ